MTQYTIYCTEEQTKKALKLGAPIENHNYTFGNNETCTYLGKDDTKRPALDWFAQQPTAEQMIGWLMEKEIFIFFNRVDNKFVSLVHMNNRTPSIISDYYSTYKEATLAAIDAALEYLSNK